MTPAMVKAMLIGGSKSASAGLDRLSGGAVGSRPNIRQGFGRLYIADLIYAGPNITLLDECPTGLGCTPLFFTDAGQTRSGQFTVLDPSKPVVIVLAWTDDPAVVNGGPTLVRDLDLTVTNGCERYSGNYINSQDNSIQQDGCNGTTFYADHTNNVEMVVLPAGYTQQYNGAVLNWRVDSTTWWGSRDAAASATQRFVIFGSNVY